jgi:hypothetical protein
MGWKADIGQTTVGAWAGPHEKIIAAAAKQALHPLGFRRKGRSRVWLADHHWWAIVVEFQPSGWSKGSYLNVAAHWLWTDNGHISFDFGLRSEGFEEYISNEQFTPAAQRLAQAAAQEAEALAHSFPSIEIAADLLIKHEASLGVGQGSWFAYNTGVAAGLANRASEADALLRSVTDERVQDAAERLLPLLPDPLKFRSEVGRLVERQRSVLGLPELSPLQI